MLNRKRIDVTITQAEGRFGEELGDTVTLTGHRVHAYINAAGGEAQGLCQCIIYGLPLSTINQLTTIGPTHYQIANKNTIQIAAGNEDETLHTVFIGTILEAKGTFNQAPDIGLSITALSGLDALAKPVGATSFKGPANVSEIMAGFAKDAGYSFKDGGVNITLSNPYFYGTTLDKIRKCARDAGIRYSIEKNVLSIWPVGGHAEVDPLTLSPGSGLVGYPELSSQGIAIRSIFLPTAELGARMIIKGSEIPMANGAWTMYTVTHSLESETPNGQWFTDIEAATHINTETQSTQDKSK